MVAFRMLMLSSVAFILLGASVFFGQTSISSGSTGAQGPFPPDSLAASIAAAPNACDLCVITLDMKTGGVSVLVHANTTTLVGTPVTLAGGATSGDKFPLGELDFTTFTVPLRTTLRFGRNTANTPITIRTTGDVLITGLIDVRGGQGTDTTDSGIAPGGKGGPGGFDGGAGGAGAVFNGTTLVRSEQPGGPGSGRNGGIAGIVLTSSSADADANGQPGQFPHTNSNLLPLIGGSGGGGGRGSTTDKYSGGGGGGGGGAILIASSTKIVFQTNTSAPAINAGGGFAGGPGGGTWPFPLPSNTGTGARVAGGGSGGAIRLIANTIQMLEGSLDARGGCNSSCSDRAGYGLIRIEAFDFSRNASFSSADPPASISQPSAIRPIDVPRLRISSIGGTIVPDTLSTTGVRGTVEVTLATSTNPVPVVVTATHIPDGTNVTVTLKTSAGPFATASAPLSGGTATVNMTLNTGVSVLQAFTGVFNVSQDLQRQLPLYDGEKVMTASVEFDGKESRTYFFTESGKRVPAEDVLASQ